jgi:hypothetical protein
MKECMDMFLFECYKENDFDNVINLMPQFETF